jgi:YedE family putative selenium metabolism protein
MMLRGEASTTTRWVAIALCALVGTSAAILVALGNPGHMGLCGACFLRDVAGALKLHQGPAILRPEVAGLALGALLWRLMSRQHVGRTGGHALVRFLLCAAMAVGALVFLGCPFRLLQRLGGGDPSAWLALPGLVLGVRAAMALERRGWSIGKTSEAPLAQGLLAPLALAAPSGLFLLGGVLAGPGPGDGGAPAHAPWLAALALALGAGAILSATGFCAISAVRCAFGGARWMLIAAVAVVAAYGGVALAGGVSSLGAAVQPIAHGDWLWNTLALALVGACGALAGGCPVRQIVMAGEGNGDAFVGCCGLLVGGALAHTLGLASAPATAAAAGGPTDAGRWAIALLLAAVFAYGVAALPRANAAAPVSGR